jgi:REP element-mobilizing transposase RayT
VSQERFADPRFAETMADLTVVDPEVALSAPAASARGRYWYNLHLVLVVAGRSRIHDLALLRSLRDSFFKIAAKKGHAVARLSVLPDHLHAALRPQSHESPLEVVFAYQNNLAHITGRRRIWSDSYYVGTFGEYTMQAVRNKADQ